MKNSFALLFATAAVALAACGSNAPSPDALPLSKPVGRSRIPRPPVDAQLNSIVHTTFLVQPNRHADLGSIKTIGTGDNAYKRDVMDLLRTELFDVPTVDGCPVWGRGDLQTMITRGRPSVRNR